MKKWLKINTVLSLKEKIILYFLVAVFVGSLAIWGIMYYYGHTVALPAYGGEYIEGIFGQPAHVNPIISQTNDTDDDLVQLIYSSLFKYDDRGQLIPDAAESYELSDDKTTYTVHLKKNIQWQDGQQLTAADVLFTAQLISDSTYKSPLRSNWINVDTEMPDDATLVFKIESPYAGFLNNLTFGILPKHIWENVSADKFPLTDLNLEPVGSGPYKYSSIQKDSKGNIISYKLAANPNYFAGKPYISKITFNFYPSDDALINAYNSKEVMGIKNLTPEKIRDLKLAQSTAVHAFNIPRYFAVFINQSKSLSLASDDVRQALAYATDRQAIVDSILNGHGKPVYSPFLPGMIGYSDDIDKHAFNPDKANQLLDQAGWTRGEDGFRAKDGTPLKFTLITTADWKELTDTAELLKQQWAKIGATVTVDTYSISDIQQNYIRPREYDALLFGQALSAGSDPYSFWHSSQKKDPGLNLALFGNSDTDKLITDARAEFDPEKRAALYKTFQDKMLQEMPAIFLYSPDYIYPINKKVQGINIQDLISPSDRFSDVSQWYISTHRVWK